MLWFLAFFIIDRKSAGRVRMSRIWQKVFVIFFNFVFKIFCMFYKRPITNPLLDIRTRISKKGRIQNSGNLSLWPVRRILMDRVLEFRFSTGRKSRLLPNPNASNWSNYESSMTKWSAFLMKGRTLIHVEKGLKGRFFKGWILE